MLSVSGGAIEPSAADKGDGSNNKGNEISEAIQRVPLL